MNNSSPVSSSQPQEVTKHAARSKLVHSTNLAKKSRDRRLEINRLKSKNVPQNTMAEQISSGCRVQASSGSNSGYRFGHVSVMGRRRVMEDSVTVAPPGWLGGEYAFFAVYDGHGGPKVAESCSERLHVFLENHVGKARTLVGDHEEKCSFEWEKVMRDCFCEMNDFIGEEDKSKERTMGTTAVVVLLGNEEVIVANCGDSRAVLCRGGAPVPLSCDHKPERPDEMERIEAAGGQVLNWNGCRVQGILSTSRSIGDHYLQPYVTFEPEVTITSLTETDSFLIIATDGLWDVMTNEISCQVVRKCLSGQFRGRSSGGNRASAAAATLAEMAVGKGSTDNISVIVVQLK